jgi:copper chaperone CopZ
MKQIVKYEVRGMTCGGCQRSVANALKQAGVEVSVQDVSLADGTVSVDAAAAEAVVRQAIEDAGFDVGQRRDQ